MAGFYGVIKPLDAHLRFVLLTGVTKFSKVSIFSKLNNLDDLTMDRRYADMLGYTEDELGTFFSDPLAALAEYEECSLEELRAKSQEMVQRLPVLGSRCCCLQPRLNDAAAG